MMQKSLAAALGIALLSMVAAAGCGPPNGKELNELNENQSKRLCKDIQANVEDCEDEDPDDYDCENYHDDFVTELPDECAATVGDLRDCSAACFDNGDAGCQAFYGCVASGG